MTFDLPVLIIVGGVALLLTSSKFSGASAIKNFDSDPLASMANGTQIFISIVVLFAALYVVIFKTDSDASQKNWAFGAIGTLLGFWLKKS